MLAVCALAMRAGGDRGADRDRTISARQRAAWSNLGRDMTLSQLIRHLIAEDPDFRDLLEDYNALLAELAGTPQDADSKCARKQKELLELRRALEDEILEALQRVLPEKVDDNAE